MKRRQRSGFSIILLHGFPDDARAFDGVAPPLVKADIECSCHTCAATGPRVFAMRPRLEWRSRRRSARMLSTSPMRFAFRGFAVAGFDWGGRAAAIAAALHPDRVRAAVLHRRLYHPEHHCSIAAGPARGGTPGMVQWYFNTERGRAGLQMNRRALCRYLWQTWSPSWHFSEEHTTVPPRRSTSRFCRWSLNLRPLGSFSSIHFEAVVRRAHSRSDG